jgi:hypothetical protein
MRSPSTTRTLKSTLAAIPAAALAVVLAVGPVSADTELGHRGQVGAHSLRDSANRGGALCTYRTLGEAHNVYWEGELRRIDVRPPRMRATAGTQAVGWRFIIRRHRDDGRSRVTYRSPIQKSTATRTQNASFSRMGVKVAAPTWFDDSWGRTVVFNYQVRVRMFWYRPDGTVQGRARHRVDYYDLSSGGSEDGSCPGWQAWVV